MIETEVVQPNGWTLVTLKDGRQRAYRQPGYGKLQVLDMRRSDQRPRVDWFVYDRTGNETLAAGETQSLDDAMTAADEAYARLF